MPPQGRPAMPPTPRRNPHPRHHPMPPRHPGRPHRPHQPHFHGGAQHGERTPSWIADLLRTIGWAIGVAVLVALMLWGAEAGVLRSRRGEAIDDLGVFAVILTLVCGAGLPYLTGEKGRADRGFRLTGLIPLVLIAAPISAAVLAASSLVWPWIGTFDAGSGTLIQAAGATGAGLFFTFAVHVTAAFLAYPFFMLLSIVPFPRSGAWLGLLGWLGVSGVCAVIAFGIGLGAPTGGRLLVLVACVLVAAVVCVIGLGLAQGLRKRSAAALPYRA